MVKMVLTWEKGQIVFDLVNGKISDNIRFPNGLTADKISQAYNRRLILGESTEHIYLNECLISEVI